MINWEVCVCHGGHRTAMRNPFSPPPFPVFQGMNSGTMLHHKHLYLPTSAQQSRASPYSSAIETYFPPNSILSRLLNSHCLLLTPLLKINYPQISLFLNISSSPMGQCVSTLGLCCLGSYSL